jgi:hypothetical protein
VSSTCARDEQHENEDVTENRWAIELTSGTHKSLMQKKKTGDRDLASGTEPHERENRKLRRQHKIGKAQPRARSCTAQQTRDTDRRSGGSKNWRGRKKDERTKMKTRQKDFA